MKVDFEKMINLYCKKLSKPDKVTLLPELEIRFDSNRGNALMKMDFDNVVRQLYSSGFKSKNKDGQHLLRITVDKSIQFHTTEISRSRIEIVGLSTIQSYCMVKEDLNELLKLPMISSSLSPMNLLKFTVKNKILLDDKTIVEDVIFKDFGFSVSYKNESHTSSEDDINHVTILKWNETKKSFRYMNRIKFEHDDYPIIADLSIIRSSRKNGRNPISEYTIENIINNENTYEIELEIDNNRAKKYSCEELLISIRKVIRIILCGLHQTNYPIGNIETKNVLQSYMYIIHGIKYNKNEVIETKDFIGPSCLTLQIDNLLVKSPININTNYCVTDKADGLRSLLYISDNGRLYLIDTTMSVIFTGTVIDTNDKKFQKSILDGEYIQFNKYGKAIHLFAVFDIYYIGNEYVGNLPFETINTVKNDFLQKKVKCRNDLMKQFIDTLKIKSIVQGLNDVIECNFQIKCKNFQFTTSNQTIYQASNNILSTLLCDEYNKDGLIFTPINRS